MLLTGLPRTPLLRGWVNKVVVFCYQAEEHVVEGKPHRGDEANRGGTGAHNASCRLDSTFVRTFQAQIRSHRWRSTFEERCSFVSYRRSPRHRWSRSTCS